MNTHICLRKQSFIREFKYHIIFQRSKGVSNSSRNLSFALFIWWMPILLFMKWYPHFSYLWKWREFDQISQFSLRSVLDIGCEIDPCQKKNLISVTTIRPRVERIAFAYIDMTSSVSGHNAIVCISRLVWMEDFSRLRLGTIITERQIFSSLSLEVPGSRRSEGGTIASVIYSQSVEIFPHFTLRVRTMLQQRINGGGGLCERDFFAEVSINFFFLSVPISRARCQMHSLHRVLGAGAICDLRFSQVWFCNFANTVDLCYLLF